MSTAAERPAYVGRDQELGVLKEALRQADEGRLALVFVEGEAGIGKSRLVQEVLAAAQAMGFHALYGKTEELERTLPFGVIRQVLEWERTVADGDRARMAQLLFDSLVSDSPEGVDIRYRIVEDVLELVEKLSTTAPVFIAFDDLHWADPSSLLVLSTLGRRLGHLPVLVLATYRPLPTNDDLLSLVEGLSEQGAVRLRLGPLAEVDAKTLATQVLGSSSAASTGRIVARAGGNPLLVIELARSVRDSGSSERPLALHPSVRSTVLRRLEHLSPGTREALQVASVLGTSFELSQLALVLGRSAVELLSMLDETQRAGIVAETEGRLAFRHDLVREAVYEGIPPPVRRALHLEAARTLARAGLPPTEVAEHFVLGAPKGDIEAVEWLREAGRDAAGRSPSVAVELFEAALNLLEPTDPLRDSVVAAMLVPLLRCGRVAQAETMARSALTTASDPSLRAQLRSGLLAILNRQDRYEEHLQESFVTYEGMSPLIEVRLKTQAVFALIHLGRMSDARRLQQEAMAAAEHSGDDRAMFIARSPSFSIATWQGHLDDAVRAARWDLEHARSHDPSPGVQALAFTLTHADHLEEARELLVHARPVAEQNGDVWGLVSYQWRLLNVQFLLGEWDDAIAEGEAALATSEETGLRGVFFQGGSVLAEILLHRNQLERAEKYLGLLESAMVVAKGHRLAVIFTGKLRGLLAEAQGDPAGAVEAMELAWTTAVETGVALAYTDVGPDLVRLLVADGNRARAREVAGQVEISANRQKTVSAKGAAWRSQGLAEDDHNMLLRAVTAMRESPRVLARANTLRDAGTAFLLTSERARGVAWLEEALGLYEHLDAQHDLRAVEAVLRTAGVARGRRGRRARPATGWDALTQTELDVVALIGQGLTAREVGQRLFISPRTVETHVAHVFAKLGCSSRAQLRAAYADRVCLKTAPSRHSASESESVWLTDVSRSRPPHDRP